MTFPTAPASHDRHVESGVNFLADNTKWQRNDEGLIVATKIFSNTNTKQSTIALPEPPQNWLTLAMAFSPKKTWAMRAVLYDVNSHFVSQDSFVEGGFNVDGGPADSASGTQTVRPDIAWGGNLTGGVPMTCWAGGWELLANRTHFLEFKLLPSAAAHEREIIMSYRVLYSNKSGHCRFTTGTLRFGGNFTDLRRIGIDMDSGLHDGTVSCRYF